MDALCHLCQPISTKLLRDNDYEHQSCPSALEASSETCAFCRLLWHSIIESCSAESVAVHLQGRLYGREHDLNTAICLRGEFHELYERVPERDIRDNIVWVCSGKDAECGRGSLYSGVRAVEIILQVG